MEAFLIEWGTEIILSLVIAMLTYYFKKDAKEKEAERREYQRLLEEERQGKTEKVMDAKIKVQLEPLYKDLEEIRRKVIKLTGVHEHDMEKLNCDHLKDLKKINDNMDLIISSYRYRLVELCKGLTNQGFMYQYQYDHLNEFYHLYAKLGGNGQAKEYYEKVCDSLEIKPNPADHFVL